MLLTMAEALLVIAISYIPFFLITIDYIMSNSGSKFEFDILILVAKSYLKPGEALVYIAGILGSTTAYFILKIIMSPRKQMAFFFCTLSPLALMYFATPVFMADRYNKVTNKDFILSYGITLALASLVVWLLSLFVQRRADLPPVMSGNAPADKIVQDLLSRG